MRTALILLALGFSAYVECMQDVPLVRQKYDENLHTNSDINQQINKELQASYLYQAYSKYFSRADVALPGFAKYFEDFSKEERGHAEKLMDYINKRGGEVSLKDIKLADVCNVVSNKLATLKTSFKADACICNFMAGISATVECGQTRDDWFTARMALEDALVLERYVNEELLNLHKNNNQDPHFADMIETDFLPEQVDSIKSLADQITNLVRVGKGLGEYIFDEKLQ